MTRRAGGRSTSNLGRPVAYSSHGGDFSRRSNQVRGRARTAHDVLVAPTQDDHSRVTVAARQPFESDLIAGSRIAGKTPDLEG